MNRPVDIDQFLIFDVLTKQYDFDINLKLGSYFPLNLSENEYYFKKIKVSEDEIFKLFNKTKTQSENSLWKEIRNCRISATLKGHKIKSCKNLTFENLAKSLLNEKDLG